MNKQLNGYFTVEASFVMPIVVFLYMLIIGAGIFVYDRCVMSQDMYLIAFRGSRFSDSLPDYGEVIYAEEIDENKCRQYAEERISQKQKRYPLFEEGACRIQLSEERLSVYGSGFRKLLQMQKQSDRCNMFKMVKEKRRKQYAGNKVL